MNKILSFALLCAFLLALFSWNNAYVVSDPSEYRVLGYEYDEETSSFWKVISPFFFKQERIVNNGETSATGPGGLGGEQHCVTDPDTGQENCDGELVPGCDCAWWGTNAGEPGDEFICVYEDGQETCVLNECENDWECPSTMMCINGKCEECDEDLNNPGTGANPACPDGKLYCDDGECKRCSEEHNGNGDFAGHNPLCPGTRPFCDPYERCQKCTEHLHCTTNEHGEPLIPPSETPYCITVTGDNFCGKCLDDEHCPKGLRCYFGKCLSI